MTAAKITVGLRRKGRPVGIQDILIAAYAITTDTPLLTRTKHHFKHISGLSLC